MSDESADEPQPKRRSALRHALGGLALVVCIGLGMWLIERRGLTDWGGSWRRAQIEFRGQESIREQAEFGMTRDEVRMRIGRTSTSSGVEEPHRPLGARLNRTESWRVGQFLTSVGAERIAGQSSRIPITAAVDSLDPYSSKVVRVRRRLACG